MSSQTNATGRTLSGKRLTIGLLMVLLGTGGLFYWVATSYGAYNAARRQTDRAWRELSAALESRYRTLDERIQEGVQQQVVDQAVAEQWRKARDGFTGTGISSTQIQSANELEVLVTRLPDSIPQADTSAAELSQALDLYTQSAQQQRDIGQSPGSRLLKLMLNLPDPLYFELPSGVSGKR